MNYLILFNNFILKREFNIYRGVNNRKLENLKYMFKAKLIY